MTEPDPELVALLPMLRVMIGLKVRHPMSDAEVEIAWASLSADMRDGIKAIYDWHCQERDAAVAAVAAVLADARENVTRLQMQINRRNEIIRRDKIDLVSLLEPLDDGDAEALIDHLQGERMDAFETGRAVAEIEAKDEITALAARLAEERDRALEEAAEIADDRGANAGLDHGDYAAECIARDIRALKTKSEGGS